MCIAAPRCVITMRKAGSSSGETRVKTFLTLPIDKFKIKIKITVIAILLILLLRTPLTAIIAIINGASVAYPVQNVRKWSISISLYTQYTSGYHECK